MRLPGGVIGVQRLYIRYANPTSHIPLAYPSHTRQLPLAYIFQGGDLHGNYTKPAGTGPLGVAGADLPAGKYLFLLFLRPAGGAGTTSHSSAL